MFPIGRIAKHLTLCVTVRDRDIPLTPGRRAYERPSSMAWAVSELAYKMLPWPVAHRLAMRL